jgi:hypothetical protein
MFGNEHFQQMGHEKTFPGSSAAGDEHVLALVDNCVHYGFLFR